jgi:lipoate---protein ligase
MLCSDSTLPTPQENLALEEALLDAAEEGEIGATLRFWQPSGYAVVVGYANRVAREVNLDYCREAGIPILRRCTGGGTVLQGPGVLNYSLILRIEPQGPTHTITSTNEFVMGRQREVLANHLQQDVQVRGHTDLAIGGLKFSGNAQRRKRNYLVFHGTFLIGLDLDLVEKTLLMPSAQPDYRFNRSHTGFLRNLDCPPPDLKAALRLAWNASLPLPEIPGERVANLVRQKYSLDAWNMKF